jgi:UDP-2-acetamido-2,6-beta-L-arabino-hexul-4-ose reductase
MMRVLITGANGFIAKNLSVRLSEFEGYQVTGFGKENTLAQLGDLIKSADTVVHLAGVNRPKDVNEFIAGNVDLTARLCDFIAAAGRRIPLVFSSSIQAETANPYGNSKRAAEEIAEKLSGDTGNPVTIYRLPNVFGKWCRPNYNSVVATFCHNIANDMPIQINDPVAQLNLVHIDDVVKEFVEALMHMAPGFRYGQVEPVYSVTLGELAAHIEAFRNCRSSLISERVGNGLIRALYSTYVSYLPPAKFAYDLPRYSDERGVFVEMLKTRDSGQFSFFTAHPGITRGGHYHHTKTEKFLVIEGSACFRFRHIVTGERHELFTTGDKPQVVETVPGWTHDITNVGECEMIVMIWANEIFDRAKPDTIACKV